MPKLVICGKMLNKVRAKFGTEYFIDNIDNKDCNVDLTDIPENRLILDLERFALACKFPESRCDYVLFIEHGERRIFCVLIELKSGRVNASHVQKQLQGGANLVKRYCQMQMMCCALLIHKSRISKVDQRKMAKDRIKFEGSVVIMRSLCGTKGNIFSPINPIFGLRQ